MNKVSALTKARGSLRRGFDSEMAPPPHPHHSPSCGLQYSLALVDSEVETILRNRRATRPLDSVKRDECSCVTSAGRWPRRVSPRERSLSPLLSSDEKEHYTVSSRRQATTGSYWITAPLPRIPASCHLEALGSHGLLTMCLCACANGLTIV